MAKEKVGPFKLEARGVTLRLDGKRVLDDISMGVREGETLVVLGPSGSGKSMLLRTLVRLNPASEGTILLDGSPVEDLDPVELRRRVNLVQQQPAMLEGTVEENLRYGLELASVPPRDIGERISKALEDASLEEAILFRRAEKLSGGERQRVAIARAHAMRPEVLLLDEPTAALDPRTTRNVEDAINRLREEGYTMIVVTHDVDQATRLGDRTVMLRQGSVIASGDSDSLIEVLDPEVRAQYMGELRCCHELDEEVTEDE
jgi:energy-coupling factor transporter ATP-binding protein EcfA2